MRHVTDTSCPTDVVRAPIELVWRLLTEPEGWGAFFDVRILRVEPPGPAFVGQRTYAESGPPWLRLAVSFVYTLIDVEHHRVRLDMQLPLGIAVREDLDCVPVGPDCCRVNYHCNFEFPRGVRGWLARRLLRRELESGPVDSLGRLKRAAEELARTGAGARQPPNADHLASW